MALIGTIHLPGDKSITHRALMLSSIAKGPNRILRPLKSEDTRATLTILRQLGVRIEEDGEDYIVYGQGNVLKESDLPLECQNSGTTARLLLGLLSGREGTYTLRGDHSLSKRPMLRVVKHLRALGASIDLTNENYLPTTILPSQLKATPIKLEVASAQVKSAVILAGLNQKEPLSIEEYGDSRDHTEQMIQFFEGDLKKVGKTITISGKKELLAKDIFVPGDLSSAAFFIVGALILPESEILIKNCGLNRTRTGLLDVLKQTGASIEILNYNDQNGEAVGDLRVRYTKDLTPFSINKTLVPRVIDEIPILSLLATQIEGTSTIRGAEELRVKETDRIASVYSELTKLGANCVEYPDGLDIKGSTYLNCAEVKTYHDHRMSMMLKIAELITGGLEIDDRTVDRISYPQFETDLNRLLK